MKRWSLTSDIVMRPEPRTASRYTVDESCELGAHNLTISGVSGRVSWISGKELCFRCFKQLFKQLLSSFSAAFKRGEAQGRLQLPAATMESL